jgi:hypothetical protein
MTERGGPEMTAARQECKERDAARRPNTGRRYVLSIAAAGEPRIARRSLDLYPYLQNVSCVSLLIAAVVASRYAIIRTVGVQERRPLRACSLLSTVPTARHVIQLLS